jgi:phosphotriesterase-related protein
MRTAVQTVTGPVPIDALGRVLAHEHVIVLNTELQENHPGDWDRGRWEEEPGIAQAVEKLRAVKAAGFDTLIDVTVFPMGRSVGRIRTISERSGVQIIAATGLYLFDTLPRPISAIAWDAGDPLVELFVRDLEDGVAGTGVRAGVIKLATDAPGITAATDRILRAGAQAHKRTGAPITTHSNASLHGGLDQQRVFAEEGVDLTRVVIGHCGDTTDLGYLETLIEAGSYIGMDRFGMHDRLSFEDRVATVAELCSRGYAERLLLSHDAWAFNDWVSAEWEAELPDWHYLHIANDVLPALRDRGVTAEQRETMLVLNPRRMFAEADPY